MARKLRNAILCIIPSHIWRRKNIKNKGTRATTTTTESEFTGMNHPETIERTCGGNDVLQVHEGGIDEDDTYVTEVVTDNWTGLPRWERRNSKDFRFPIFDLPREIRDMILPKVPGSGSRGCDDQCGVCEMEE